MAHNDWYWRSGTVESPNLAQCFVPLLPKCLLAVRSFSTK